MNIRGQVNDNIISAHGGMYGLRLAHRRDEEHPQQGTVNNSAEDRVHPGACFPLKYLQLG